MKVHRVTMIFFDFDNVRDDLKEIIENAQYPNDCLTPAVAKIETVEVVDWSDDLPINKINNDKNAEFDKLLKKS